MLRYTTCATALAFALSIGGAASAAAQQRDSTRSTTRTARTTRTTRTSRTTRTAPRHSRSQLPVKKEQPASSTTGAAASSGASGGMSSSYAGATRRDTVFVGRADTTVVMCNCAATQAASGGEVLPLIPARIQRMFGNGLYAGLGAASVMALGDLMQSYNPGWGLNVPIGWDPPKSPLGVRVNLGYATFNSASTIGVADAKEYSANADVKFRVPFGHFMKSSSGAYLVGGAGVHHFTNYNQTIYLTNNLVNTKYSTPQRNAQFQALAPSQPSTNTSWGTNIGAGLSLGVGPAELFAESRYTRVYTPGKAINYLPIVGGVTFH